MKNVLGFFLYYNFKLLQKKKRKSQKFMMGNPWFSEFYQLLASRPFLTLKKSFYGISSKLKICRYSSFLSGAARIRSIRHLWKSYGKNIEIVQDVSKSGFFQFWLGWISFFPFLFSYVFDLLNTLKTMLQLILTLGFFWQHVCMISLMVLIFY